MRARREADDALREVGPHVEREVHLVRRERGVLVEREHGVRLDQLERPVYTVVKQMKTGKT